MLTHVVSQKRQWPREYGYTVAPYGRFPSSRQRPDASSIDGIPVAERPHRITSFMAESRGTRPALKRKDKGCVPNASTVVPHCVD